MTEKEIVDIAESMGMYRDGDIWFSNTPDYQDVLTTDLVILVNRAIEKEREECAKIADSYADGLERNYSEIIADKIRARGNND